ncbi:hypothetical protein BDV06DRAFT_171782 [Aspergillus oleicola]
MCLSAAVQLSPSFQVPGILASLTSRFVCIYSCLGQGDYELSRVSKGDDFRRFPPESSASRESKGTKHYLIYPVHLVLDLAWNCCPGILDFPCRGSGPRERNYKLVVPTQLLC